MKEKQRLLTKCTGVEKSRGKGLLLRFIRPWKIDRLLVPLPRVMLYLYTRQIWVEATQYTLYSIDAVQNRLRGLLCD